MQLILLCERKFIRTRVGRRSGAMKLIKKNIEIATERDATMTSTVGKLLSEHWLNRVSQTT